MAKLRNSINSVIFPSEADELIIEDLGEANAGGFYEVKLTLLNLRTDVEEELVGGEFFPHDGVISLDDLSGFICDYLDGDLMFLFLYVNGKEVLLNEHNDTHATVIRSRLPIAMSAEYYCENHFLDLNNKVFASKQTYPAARERLSAYVHVDEISSVATVSATYLLNGKVGTTEANIFDFDDSDFPYYGTVVTFDASPAMAQRHVPEGGVLLAYDISLGRRKQSYRVTDSADLVEPLTLEFINNFGQVDTYHFFGERERSFKPSYSAARMKGKKRNYYVIASPTWTAHNKENMEPGLLEDLAVSWRVWRLPDMTEVVITDCDMKTSDGMAENADVSISFQESTRQYGWHPARAVKTFDDTFDNTFF